MTPIVAVTSDGRVVPYPDHAPVAEVDVRGDLRAGRNPLSKIRGSRRTHVGHVYSILTRRFQHHG